MCLKGAICGNVSCDSALACLQQDPARAMREHSDFAQLFSADAYAAGFGEGAVSHLIDVATENQKQAGIFVAEVGAGSGSFTRQVRLCACFGSPDYHFC